MKLYSFTILLILIVLTMTIPVKVDQVPYENHSGTQIFDNVEIALYPNPVYEVATVKSNRLLTKITVLNVMGKAVKNFDIEEPKKLFKADVSTLPVGMYFIRFYGEENKLLKTYKLLKYDNAS